MTTTPEQHVIGLKQAFSTLGLLVVAAAGLVGAIVALDRSGWVRFSLVGVVLLVAGGLGLVALALVRWWLLARHGWSWTDLGFRRPGPRILHLLWQVPLIIITGAIVQGVFTVVVLGDPEGSTDASALDDVVVGAPAWAVAAVVVAVCVITPLWEEALFRGAFFSGFSRRLSAPLAIVATGVLFAAVHALPPALPYLVVVGIGLTWLRWFHHHLWAPVVMHAVNNGIVTLGALLLV